MSSRARRISIALGLLLALGLVVGAVSANRSSDDDDGATTEATATTPVEIDPYPLATGTTPPDVQTAVFERAYSECASGELAGLAAKYKSDDTTEEGVAAAVGRGWASYFKAGSDAVQDGRDGCLQGLREGSS